MGSTLRCRQKVQESGLFANGAVTGAVWLVLDCSESMMIGSNTLPQFEQGYVGINWQTLEKSVRFGLPEVWRNDCPGRNIRAIAIVRLGDLALSRPSMTSLTNDRAPQPSCENLNIDRDQAKPY